MYNSEREMSTQKTVARLGPKEKEVLAYLRESGGQAWQQDLLDKFAWASKYQNVFLRRLYRLQEKGYITVGVQINPDTGRMKKKVYLVK